jgi:small nuclear ribonucleoprotein (snRNP)-like protein
VKTPPSAAGGGSRNSSPAFSKTLVAIEKVPDERSARRRSALESWRAFGNRYPAVARAARHKRADHVVKGSSNIEITTKDNRRFKAQLVGRDQATDIALLRIKAENLTEIPLGDSDKLEVGDFVLAIGNPFGLGQAVTSGIISALGRTATLYDVYAECRDGPHVAFLKVEPRAARPEEPNPVAGLL